MSLTQHIYDSINRKPAGNRDELVAPQLVDGKRKYAGTAERPPWGYSVTVAIPHLDTPDLLEVLIELHQLQTVRPYIVVVDTGSRSANLNRVLAMRAENVEVHCVAMHGSPHPSDYPAVAMDLALSCCRTEYLFATHSDCLPRRRDLLAWYLAQCNEYRRPVVGYEMSPRAIDEYKGMVSHTATMMHVATLDRIGFGYSQRRLVNVFNPPVDKPGECGGWPDTEILGNMILRQHGIEPHLIGGPETNYERWVDDNIDHIRTVTAGMMYSPGYWKKCQVAYQAAMSEAKARVTAWKADPSAM